MSGCRIGRIKMKGGADLHILNTPTGPHGENWAGKLITNAKKVAEYEAPGCDLVGYLVFGLFSDGSHSSGFRWDANRSPIPRRMMPAFIAEIVREELVTEELAQQAAADVFNQGPIG